MGLDRSWQRRIQGLIAIPLRTTLRTVTHQSASLREHQHLASTKSIGEVIQNTIELVRAERSHRLSITCKTITRWAVRAWTSHDVSQAPERLTGQGLKRETKYSSLKAVSLTLWLFKLYLYSHSWPWVLCGQLLFRPLCLFQGRC